ncbi:sensor histidine kinase [Paenibacillus ginsengarvi]|uniref:histidine kinase n=1 Tax=Paenibacillus ginsengarvi TaxID=400777 RepID=A0A3B0AJN0_9BACL|nr:HAMP domain-containing sensor histidine kinase [Paenibacillus ginsengarvi]RKN60839.1 sensor histidine kinase [Paenibacillus ginsengarvi]
MWMLVIAAAVLLVMFWMRRRRETSDLRKISEVLEDVLTGNPNRRFRIRAANRSIRTLCEQLNLLLDQHQSTFKKAQFLEQSREQMISNMSHDLQTPLATMLGYVEALHSDASSLSQEERSKYLLVVLQKGERLSRLFREFFQLAKLEADDTLHKLVQVNLPEKVDEIASAFDREFENNAIEPQIDIPFEAVYVWGEPHFIERILYNLISNAIRYGKSGGVIGISLRRDRELVWIDVWDRGPGIRSADLPHIFERLYTGEASRNSGLQGNGLGLTIAKKLAEKQNGEIRVESLPNERTTFSFGLRPYTLSS